MKNAKSTAGAPIPYTVTVYTKFGAKSIDTFLTVVAAEEIARTEMAWNTFASSLVEQYAGKRGLSAKQLDWLVYLAQEHLDKKAVKALASAAPVAAPAVVIGDLAGVYGLFDEAKKYLKRVKVRVNTSRGQRVVLSVATRGRFPGSLIVTDGRAFGENKFFGYVHADGTTTVKDADVLDVLKRLAADPAKTAAEYGKGTGDCCFCGRALTNSELGSAEIGYGPICAKHFGLPWTPNGKTFTATEGNEIHVDTDGYDDDECDDDCNDDCCTHKNLVSSRVAF